MHKIIVVILFAGFLISCEQSAGDSPSSSASCEFANEELITITGYSLDAMEVDISYDGEILMFNDRVKDPPNNKDMHWASRVTDTEYQYRGKVTDVNGSGVDGTPTFDQNDNVYYTSTGNFNPVGDVKTLFGGITSVSGSVISISSIAALTNSALYGSQSPPSLISTSLDPDISSNGQYMFYSLFQDDSGTSTYVDKIDIIATETDGAGGFNLMDQSILDDVNLDPPYINYAPTISNNGLEMYFTRACVPAPAGSCTPGEIIGIFKATRAKLTEAFTAEASPHPAITGVVEAPAFNGDQTALYYHRKDQTSDPVYKIYRVTRDTSVACN